MSKLEDGLEEITHSEAQSNTKWEVKRHGKLKDSTYILSEIQKGAIMKVEESNIQGNEN